MLTRCLMVLMALSLGAVWAPARPHDPFDSPVSDEVFYHIMPIAWRDSDGDTYRFGDFGGLTDSLDYLESLGVTSVWLNPIFPSPAYHGYQHGRADLVNTRFGTEQGFLDFVAAAHARGIKVYLDFVVYGISHDSPWFQSAFGNPSSQFDSWLAFTNQSNTQYLGATFPTWNGATVGFIHWDLRNQQVFDLVTGWAKKWLDPDGDGVAVEGVAGYRFDHVWVNYPSGPSGWGYNLTSFWRPFFEELRALKPGVFNFGEQADWGSFGGEFLSDFDAMFTKPFEFAARSALANENAQALYERMDTTVSSARAAGRGTLMTIIGDHDVDRLASSIGADQPGKAGRVRAAAAVLMLQPFAPVIYYGDEIGMRGVKGNYGSDANDIPMREPFKWNAVAGAPMSNYHALNGPATSNLYAQNNDGRSVEEQEGVAGSTLETYRSLIALRHAQPALRRGDYRPVSADRSAVWSFVRFYAPEGEEPQTLLVVINLGQGGTTASVNLSAYEILAGGGAVVDVAGGGALQALAPGNQASYPVAVGGFGYRVLRLEGVVPPEPAESRVSGENIPARFGQGNLIATQDTATTFGNNANELNQMFVEREAEGVLIGLTGNLNTDGTALVVLIDGKAGGQTVLDLLDQSPPPGGMRELSGTVLDAGFTPETMFFINAFGSSTYVDQVTLSAGGSAKAYRGRGTVNIGDGLLTGGANPNGVEFALNNTNTAGVTSSSAADAASATTGAELWVSYADLGLETPHCGGLRIAAFISGTNGLVSSQWLPGIGGAAQNLGIAPDMDQVPGEQFTDAGAVPSSCAGALCPGDANGDGVVDFNDITEIVGHWLANYTPASGPGDGNGDGVVDFGDVTAALANWLAACD